MTSTRHGDAGPAPRGGLAVTLRPDDAVPIGDGFVTCIAGRTTLLLSFPPEIASGRIVKRPGPLALPRQKRLSPAAQRHLREDWEARFQGVAKAFQVPRLEKGPDSQVVR